MSDQTEKKESRTDRLLRILQVPDDFKDPRLPSEVFSHSQYNSWMICGKAYEFKYVKKISTPEYVATTNGSAVHKGIEHTLLSKMQGVHASLEEGRAIVKKVIEEKAKLIVDWGVGTEDEDAMNADKLQKKALRLFDSFYVHALPQINPIAIEKGFAKRLGDVPMIGYIDLVEEVPALVVPGMTPEESALAPKKRVTVDFKTSTKKWSQSQLDTNTQLTLYAFVEGTPDVRIDQFVDLKKGPVYHRGASTRTAADAEILVDHLNEVADFVRQGVFPKTEIGHWSCNKDHCSFYALCRGKKK